MTVTLYLLELQKNKFYVGQTNNVEFRFKEHQIGEGSKWTRLYRPIKILKTRIINVDNLREAILYENWMTLHTMEKFGWRNVRGGDYLIIEEYQLKNKLNSIFNTEKNLIRYYVKSHYLFGASDKWLIYILRLENKKYYVGSTKRLGKSLSKHYNSKGIKWTKDNKPIEVIEIITNQGNHDYRILKKIKLSEYQKKFGEENVLGGQIN